MTENLNSCRVKSIMNNILKNDFPILDTKNRRGHTDYIDYIQKKEVTHPIMKGKDCYNRPFLIIQCIINKSIYIQTFFQRYSDDNELWMGCRVCGSPSFIQTVGGMNKHQAYLLQDIVQNNLSIVQQYHKPEYQNLFGKKIMVYDEKKEKAAKIIQYYWDICRYHPKYNIFKKIFKQDILNCKISLQN